MSTPILATKLFAPQPRPSRIERPRLFDQLNANLHRKLTLISAPAGFGKTTLVVDWLSAVDRPTAWLSLDEGDNDLTRFLTYLVAALQTVVVELDPGVVVALASPQPPSLEAVLTTLLNRMMSQPDPFVLVLDDYHLIESPAVDSALAFLVEHQPPHMHLVITTREDPHLPLARYRVRGQLTEIRATELRFTAEEAADFLNEAMDLGLSAEDVAALESRTEGWIAGLQLAALALQGSVAPHSPTDTSAFIQSFTGSHRFVMDYLVEEVLQQQPESIQTFLLATSILDRMCGSLCDALLDGLVPLSVSGQQMLEQLEQANLFLVPLDNQRGWYRYHHLFADLLRQRLFQQHPTVTGSKAPFLAELHRRASEWFEANQLSLEAFHHATATGDLDRVERVVEGGPMPLQLRGGALPVRNWIDTLPPDVLASRPVLCVSYGSAQLMLGQVTGIEDKLQAAEGWLPDDTADPVKRSLIGRIASIRATLAVTVHRGDVIETQGQRALAYLSPDNLAVITAVNWTLGYGYELKGDREAALAAYLRAESISQRIGHYIIEVMSLLGRAGIEVANLDFAQAEDSARRMIAMAGDPPMAVACAAYLALAEIAYERNELDSAERYAELSLPLAQQFHVTVDRTVATELFQAQIHLARGDYAISAEMLTRAAATIDAQNFGFRRPALLALQVRLALAQGDIAAAETYLIGQDAPLSAARVALAKGNSAEALTLATDYRTEMTARRWQDERLHALVVQALAANAAGESALAEEALVSAVALAAPAGVVRSFVDEGATVAALLRRFGGTDGHAGRILAAFDGEEGGAVSAEGGQIQSLVEPLSERELEVLALIAQGLSNREISQRLYLALSTVKGHNRNIYGKLQVQRRTEAVARARELQLI